MKTRGIHRHIWLLLPGLWTAAFAVTAIVCPVGSDGLGARLNNVPGPVPGLARLARDIHDGFWQPHAVRPGWAVSRDPERTRAQWLCYRGRAEEAVAAYQQLRVRTEDDRAALWQLADRLVIDGDYDRCEQYVRAADRLLGGGSLRNNLAWHFTQTDQRSRAALDLALSSVGDDRNACNVDTLAWAYYRNGELAVARSIARETLAFPSGRTSWSYEEDEAKDSSRRLLKLLDDAELALPSPVR